MDFSALADAYDFLKSQRVGQRACKVQLFDWRRELSASWPYTNRWALQTPFFHFVDPKQTARRYEPGSGLDRRHSAETMDAATIVPETCGGFLLLEDGTATEQL